MLVYFPLGARTFQQQVKLGVCGKHSAHHVDLSKQILHVKLTSPAGHSAHIWDLIMDTANIHLLQWDQEEYEQLSA